MSGASLLLILLVVGTLPAVVRLMLPPLPEDDLVGEPGAVVVLGGGRSRHATGMQPSAASLRRARQGMTLAAELGLPLLLSGGGRGEIAEGLSEANLMAEPVRRHWPEGELWLEEESSNTWENASQSARLLVRKGVSRVLLVTDRSHMPRALLSFQAQGLEVKAAPIETLPEPDWMPSAGALSLIPEIYYEWTALIWYYLRRF